MTHVIPQVVQAATAFCVSLAASLCFTPLARRAARRHGFVDKPDGARKLQRQPVALLGGVAVLAGLAVTVVVAIATGFLVNLSATILLVCLGLIFLCAVGVCDDAWNLGAGWKLLGQVVAAIPIVYAGCAISNVKCFDTVVPLGVLGFGLAVLWLVTCTNAVNLIDGMDGLCSTVGLCVAAGVVAIGCLTDAKHTVVCAAGLAGSLAGFLVYNRPPATIYLGDAGSMVIGMILGLLTMRASQDISGLTHPMMMVILMAIPFADLLLAMLRRKLNGKPMWQADRAHIHHRLLDRGLSVPKALAMIAALCIATNAIAVGTQLSASALFGGVAIVLFAAILVNRQWAGHHEWSLLRSLFAQRSLARHQSAAANAPPILRFDTGIEPVLWIHRPNGSPPETAPDTQSDESLRRAA